MYRLFVKKQLILKAFWVVEVGFVIKDVQVVVSYLKKINMPSERTGDGLNEMMVYFFRIEKHREFGANSGCIVDEHEGFNEVMGVAWLMWHAEGILSDLGENVCFLLRYCHCFGLDL